jgi:hypothetical protein
MNFSRGLPSPSPLNFFAGLFAGAGINMLTSVSSGDPGQPSSLKLGIDSFLWVLAAGFLTWAAHILEEAEREAALYIDRGMSDHERREIRQANLKQAAPKAVWAIALTGLSVLAAIFLLPGLIDWSALFD